MANTPPIAVDVRRFRWHDLSPDDGAAMIELVRSLGLNPDNIATDFAITRASGGEWRLHLNELQCSEDGQTLLDARVFDGVALPEFLTAQRGPDEAARLRAEVERLRAVVDRAERDNCGCLGYPLDGTA